MSKFEKSTSTSKKSKKSVKKTSIFFSVYEALWQTKFFCPTRHSMGIPETDFERILGVPFFIVVFTLSPCEVYYKLSN